MIDDLKLIEESSRISGNDINKEYGNLKKTVLLLEEEKDRNESKIHSSSFSSPTAKSMIDQYNTRLNEYLDRFCEKLNELEKSVTIMNKKVVSIAEYFGEDPQNCDSSNIFGVLQEFRRALAFSKEAVEWRIYRANSQQQIN